MSWPEGAQCDNLGVPMTAERIGLIQVLPFPQQPVAVASVASLPQTEDLPGGTVFEPKFDGRRALLFVERGICRIQSRRGDDMTDAFPEIAAAAVQWLPGGVVLDGEIVIWGRGRADFDEFRRRLSGQTGVRSLHANTVSFVAFDVLAGAGIDMRASPFRVRRHALEILLEDALPPLHIVPQTRVREQAHAWLQSYAETRVGIDGVVAKGTATRYAPGSAAWQRVRIQESAVFVVWAVAGQLRRPTRLMLATPDGAGGLRHAGWSAQVSALEGQQLGQVLIQPQGPHPWPGFPSTANLPGWEGPAESLMLVDPQLVVEVENGPGAASDFVRQRPDLHLADLDQP